MKLPVNCVFKFVNVPSVTETRAVVSINAIYILLLNVVTTFRT